MRDPERSEEGPSAGHLALFSAAYRLLRHMPRQEASGGGSACPVEDVKTGAVIKYLFLSQREWQRL